MNKKTVLKKSIEAKQNKKHQRFLLMLHTAFGDQLNDWLNDNDIIEIMLNPNGAIFIESQSKGKIATSLTLEKHKTLNIIKLLASLHNHIIDEQQPELATEIPEINARFQGWIYPVVTSPCFSIRKHVSEVTTLDDYIATNSATQQQVDIIRTALDQRDNMIIIGGTGTGKTTLANAILHELNQTQDRLIILEDLPELKVTAPDIVHLRTTETVNMRLLVKGTLRMRPDRIIIGEVRDGAALDLLKAWNTGHPGGLCTLHANSPDSLPQRLEQLIQESIPIVPKNLISQTVDLIIHIRREEDGHRVISSICHLDDKNNEYIVTEL